MEYGYLDLKTEMPKRETSNKLRSIKPIYLIVVSAKEAKFLKNEDDRFRLPTSTVQALQQELEMFGERSEDSISDHVL